MFYIEKSLGLMRDFFCLKKFMKLYEFSILIVNFFGMFFMSKAYSHHDFHDCNMIISYYCWV